MFWSVGVRFGKEVTTTLSGAKTYSKEWGRCRIFILTWKVASKLVKCQVTYTNPRECPDPPKGRKIKILEESASHHFMEVARLSSGCSSRREDRAEHIKRRMRGDFLRKMKVLKIETMNTSTRSKNIFQRMGALYNSHIYIQGSIKIRKMSSYVPKPARMSGCPEGP